VSSYTNTEWMATSETATGYNVVVEVGGIPIAIETSDIEFVHILHRRYGDYVKPSATPEFSFRVQLIPPTIRIRMLM
jgi:hypothetical protein